MTTHELAVRIDIAGIEAVAPELDDLVIEARRRGAPATIVDILADTTQPEMARLRSFARLSAWMARPGAALPLELQLAC